MLRVPEHDWRERRLALWDLAHSPRTQALPGCIFPPLGKVSLTLSRYPQLRKRARTGKQQSPPLKMLTKPKF